MINKINELLQEFRTVFSGRTNTADTIIPPLLYALVNMLAGLLPATLSALVLAAILTVLRLVRKQSWLYALSGLVLTLLAAGLAWFTQNAASFFLPDLLTSGILLAAALLSIWVRKTPGCLEQPPDPRLAEGMVLAAQYSPGLHRGHLDVDRIHCRTSDCSIFPLPTGECQSAGVGQCLAGLAGYNCCIGHQLSLRHLAIGEIGRSERGRIFIPPACPLERSKERFLVTDGESIRAFSSYRLHNLPDRPIFDLPSFQAEELH